MARLEQCDYVKLSRPADFCDVLSITDPEARGLKASNAASPFRGQFPRLIHQVCDYAGCSLHCAAAL